MDEFARIQYWTAPHGRTLEGAEHVEVGIGDDAALVRVGAGRVLVATDTMVEGVHFSDATMRPADVGYKALAANVSDLFAMGGVPRHAVIAVTVPPHWSAERMHELYDGLYACAAQYEVAIVGGDTTSTAAEAPLVVTVTVVGELRTAQPLLRSGAQPGDLVFVTGPLGLAAAGLDVLQAAEAGGAGRDREPYEKLVAAHQRPQPSRAALELLVQEAEGITSLNDISDGLASEAWELAEASGVTIGIHEAKLPLSASLSLFTRDGERARAYMLYGGEDYVLVGTVKAARAKRVQARFLQEGEPFFVIGKVITGNADVKLIRGDGTIEPLAKRGFNHF